MSLKWRGGATEPPLGLSLSPALLHDHIVIGRDDLQLPEASKATLSTAAQNALERIINRNDLGGLMGTIEKIVDAARPVGLISTAIGAGTGFMISRDLLLTNNHVFAPNEATLAKPEDAAGATVMFNFQQDANGKFAKTSQYTINPAKQFGANLELDYAVVHVDGSPGDTWGTLSLPTNTPDLAVSDDVFIIQHPEGGPKQIVLSGNEVAYLDDNIVQYTTDTQPGSSGSPVFDYAWRPVALHHRGGDLIEPASGKHYFRNEGVWLHLVQRDLAHAAHPH